MFGQTAYFLITLIGDSDNPAFTASHFFNITENLGVRTISGCNENNRHILVDQGDRAMLHFSGWITFGMNIGDFLELQRPFKSNWKVVAPTQIECIPCVLELFGYMLDPEQACRA